VVAKLFVWSLNRCIKSIHDCADGKRCRVCMCDLVHDIWDRHVNGRRVGSLVSSERTQSLCRSFRSGSWIMRSMHDPRAETG
jgi:hypothetical protein